MDTLKPFDEVTQPDERWESFVRLVSEPPGFRPVKLSEHHADIAMIELNPSVPERIREHFETAKNLLLYSWFVYRFIPVAEMHAYATAEMALRERAKTESIGGRKSKALAALMREAIARKWIVDEGFEISRRSRVAAARDREIVRQMAANLGDYQEEHDAQHYCKILAQSMSYLRNELAHGSGMLHPGGLGTLAICADLINQLFAQKTF